MLTCLSPRREKLDAILIYRAAYPAKGLDRFANISTQPRVARSTATMSSNYRTPLDNSRLSSANIPTKRTSIPGAMRIWCAQAEWFASTAVTKPLDI